MNHLDEAQFTLRYYDAQTDNPTGNAKYTWIFRTAFDDEGKAIVKFDRAHFVEGDSIDTLTNSAGLFFLPLGTFTIEETLAPKLYARDTVVEIGMFLALPTLDNQNKEEGQTQEQMPE